MKNDDNDVIAMMMMMPSQQQQSINQSINQPAMNHKNDAILTTTNNIGVSGSFLIIFLIPRAYIQLNTPLYI